MNKMDTVDVDELVNVLISQHGYILNEKNEGGYIMENTSLPELGDHSLLLHCDYDTGEVKELIGQVKGEPNREEKYGKILELINNASLSIINNLNNIKMNEQEKQSDDKLKAAIDEAPYELLRESYRSENKYSEEQIEEFIKQKKKERGIL